MTSSSLNRNETCDFLLTHRLCPRCCEEARMGLSERLVSTQETLLLALRNCLWAMFPWRAPGGKGLQATCGSQGQLQQWPAGSLSPELQKRSSLLLTLPTARMSTGGILPQSKLQSRLQPWPTNCLIYRDLEQGNQESAAQSLDPWKLCGNKQVPLNH